MHVPDTDECKRKEDEWKERGESYLHYYLRSTNSMNMDKEESMSLGMPWLISTGGAE